MCLNEKIIILKSELIFETLQDIILIRGEAKEGWIRFQIVSLVFVYFNLIPNS